MRSADADAVADSFAPESPSSPAIPWLDDGRPAIVSPIPPYDADLDIACPEPSGLDVSDALFVSAGAHGDGTRDLPYGTIGEALATATSGMTIVIEPGDYEGPLVVTRPVTIRGACANLVTIRGVDAAPVITVSSDGVSLHDLSIGPALGRGISLTPAASIEASGIVVDGTVDGLVVEGNAKATLTRAWFTNNTGSAIHVSRAEQVDLDRLALRHNQHRALRIEDGHVTLKRSIFEDNGEGDVLVRGPETEVVMQDIVSRASRGRGEGLRVELGATVTVERARFDDHGGGAVAVEMASATLRDVELHRNDFAVRVYASSLVHIVGMGAYGTRTVALFADGDQAVLRGCRIAIAGERCKATDTGRGVQAQRRAQVFIREAELSDLCETAFASLDQGTLLHVTDVVVHDTFGRALDSYQDGRGFSIRSGSRLEAARVLLDRVHAVGLFVADPGTTFQVDDLVVRDGKARVDNGTGGRAVDVENGASGTLTRAALIANREVSLLVASGADVEARDVSVADTRNAACADRCPYGAGGIGVGAYEDGHLDLARFEIVDAAVCGVQVAYGGSLDLRDGVVRGSENGACVPRDYFVDRLRERVDFGDNDWPLSSGDSVPPPIGP